MKKTILLIAFLAAAKFGYSQVPYDKNKNADVQKYTFSLALNDSTNAIGAESQIEVAFDGSPETFSVDLIGKQGTYGMTVTEVFDGDAAADYTFENNRIVIEPKPGEAIRSFTIRYEGIAERGLVIDTTKYGNRSFFGDNWPTLGRYWLASVDNPYDKAAVEFRITAPAHYDVVATGKKIEESYLENGFKLTRYVESAPVATKVMTIGVCEFASTVMGTVDNIEISAWVYPENRLEGFSDYTPALPVMRYFIDHIGPYAFSKLANMQAKTQWGGLENAGTIAYRESSVNGKGEVEGLIAHEIAHQWFGNSATEGNWNHVWLSEGFATYFTILYLEQVYGDERRQSELIRDRNEIISYFAKNPSSVVDYSITTEFKVLSTNTYQKGSWVLNMLRRRLGDEVFWEGIRKYYTTYFNANALTEDLRKIMEDVSGDDLEDFFQQWIYTKGYPELSWNWKYKKGKLVLDIEQIQEHHTFRFPLEIGIKSGGETQIKKIEVTSASERFEIDLDTKPENVVLDPESWLLFHNKSE